MITPYDQQYLEIIKRMSGSGMEVHLVIGNNLRKVAAGDRSSGGSRAMPAELRTEISGFSQSTLELSEFSANQLVNRSADAPQARTKADEGHNAGS